MCVCALTLGDPFLVVEMSEHVLQDVQVDLLLLVFGNLPLAYKAVELFDELFTSLDVLHSKLVADRLEIFHGVNLAFTVHNVRLVECPHLLDVTEEEKKSSACRKESSATFCPLSFSGTEGDRAKCP